MTNVTIAFNESPPLNGAVFNGSDVNDLQLLNTIVAENIPVDCSGDVTSSGNNLDSDGTCLDGSVPGDIPSGNANLGPLADNGGPTPTHALLTGSDAIDAGDQATCETVSAPWDQRGQPFNRIEGPTCEIGAFEVQLEAPTPAPTATQSPSATVTPTVTLVPGQARITIRKETVGGLQGEFSFTSDFSTPFQLEHGESQTVEVEAGTYVVREATLTSFQLQAVQCTGDGSSTTLLDGVRITVDVGDETTCTFFNGRPHLGAFLNTNQGAITATPVPQAVAPISPPSTGDGGLR